MGRSRSRGSRGREGYFVAGAWLEADVLVLEPFFLVCGDFFALGDVPA